MTQNLSLKLDKIWIRGRIRIKMNVSDPDLLVSDPRAPLTGECAASVYGKSKLVPHSLSLKADDDDDKENNNYCTMRITRWTTTAQQQSCWICWMETYLLKSLLLSFHWIKYPKNSLYPELWFLYGSRSGKMKRIRKIRTRNPVNIYQVKFITIQAQTHLRGVKFFYDCIIHKFPTMFRK